MSTYKHENYLRRLARTRNRIIDKLDELSSEIQDMLYNIENNPNYELDMSEVNLMIEQIERLNRELKDLER